MPSASHGAEAVRALWVTVAGLFRHRLCKRSSVGGEARISVRAWHKSGLSVHVMTECICLPWSQDGYWRGVAKQSLHGPRSKQLWFVGAGGREDNANAFWPTGWQDLFPHTLCTRQRLTGWVTETSGLWPLERAWSGARMHLLQSAKAHLAA